MLDLILLIPVLPFAGFLALLLFGRRVPAGVAAAIGTGSVGLSMVVALLVLAECSHAPSGFSHTLTLWTWLRVDGLAPSFGLYVDGLSLVMVVVVTVVGFLIHLYSTRFMEGDEGYARFFAYMNLFVGSMLTLVLADNLLFLYLGWEGVGLCSYLLIGFWYREPANAHAAIKAFVVTRIGDTAFVIGLFLLFTALGTLDIQELALRAGRSWAPGSLAATAAAALLLAGAVGKSAQLPLQTWLPDAMAGPTPVSALIHAATMVTAGVYLIARMHALFSLAPRVLFLVAVIGAVTLLVAAASALTQRDIKRVLAYSTMSQVGYMFLALGVGAWSAAIFHFMVHAFFKALLFLGAGVVIQALDNEHDIFRMGGLRKGLPVAFWTFLAGAASLSALPFVTAGFYSKEMILSSVRSSSEAGTWLWTAGITGAFLTSVYSFRVVFVAFFGPDRAVRSRSALPITIPLVILAVLSLGGGLLQLPIGAHTTPFAFLARTALPGAPLAPATTSARMGIETVASLASLLGILVAYILYVRRPAYATALTRRPPGSVVHDFWFSGWGFDRLYGICFVSPFTWLARVDRSDFIDLFYRGLAGLTALGSRRLVLTQSGKVRWYVMGIALGAAIFVGMVIFL
ncbi:MAG: NADH-quinone oxidoreductase subunit L [Syntrophorhabdales bacterium]|jgi:NADH-quinone oxidoreductase subunit L